ncbi:MAG TPA: hypothetical protein VEU47_11215 [Candidatus Cybelea sp.]|nr:hypothetical protein [Candidatus Cybelea sp.]
MSMKAAAIWIALASFVSVTVPGNANAADFQVGDRVMVGSTRSSGTVIEIGQALTDGGTMVKVHLDSMSPAFPNVGVWYDSLVSKVTVVGGGAAPAPAAPAPPQPAPPAPQDQKGALPPPAAPPAVGSNTAPPGKVPVSAQACMQAIRANYPPAGADQTITVNFQTIQISGPQSYTATYANDNNGVGHTVQASPVHAKYTVLTHFADPSADDILRTYDANYMCYRTATTGELIVEMTSRVPGGETPTYIKKR